MSTFLSIQKKRITNNFESIWILEIIFVSILIGILVFFAVREYSRVAIVTTVIARLHESWPIKSEIYRFYALNQYWPDKDELVELSNQLEENMILKEVVIESGSIDLVFNDDIQPIQSKVLSLRKVEFNNQPGATIMWICGYKTIPEGMHTNAKNNTTIPANYLPIQCK